MTTASPWDRYGWLMAAVWLVFLGFPIAAVWSADQPLWLRVAGLVAIAAFAVIYLHGLIRLEPMPDRARVERFAAGYLLVLVALTAAVCAIGGSEGTGTFPFIVALAMFTLRWSFSIPVAVLGIALPIVLVELGATRPGAQFISLIVALVAVATGLVCFLDQRESAHRATQRELEMVAERDRVARDVHDVLGHSLTVVATKAELAERLMVVDPERAADELRQIQTMTRQALAEIRATVSGLRAAQLDTELASARLALAAAEIEGTVPESGEVVEPRCRLVLAWALREAVTNVVRHSGASRCEVRLDPRGLAVVDDGRGLTGAAEGNGLLGLRERVEAAGGTVTTGPPADGAGTCIEVRL